MLQYSQSLRNPFYFFTDNILFKIDSEQDNDGCGNHLVTYQQSTDKNGQPITKTVKIGDRYLDETHTLRKALSNMEVPVYSDDLDLAKCRKVFPNFVVNYETVPDEGETEVTQFSKTYFIQNAIAVGDKCQAIDGERILVKFVMNNVHDDESDTDYLSYFRDGIAEDIQNYFKKGYDINKIKASMPYWVFKSNVDNEYLVDGKKVKFTGLEGFALITEDEMWDGLYKRIETDTNEFANKKLAAYGKKIKIENTIIINKDTVKDI